MSISYSGREPEVPGVGENARAVSQSYGAGSSASMPAPLGSYVTRGYSRDVEQVKMSRQMHDNRIDSRGSGDARGRRSQLVHAEIRGVEFQGVHVRVHSHTVPMYSYSSIAVVYIYPPPQPTMELRVSKYTCRCGAR